MMKTHQEIRAAVAVYAGKEAAILANVDLSEIGRQKQLDDLRATRLQTLHDLIDDLRKEAILTAIKHERKAGVIEAIGELDAEKLDWSRLQYEAKAVEGAVRKSVSVYDLVEVFEGVKKRSDKYQLKAWRDMLPSLIPDEDLEQKEWKALIENVESAHLNLLTDEQIKIKIDQEEMLEDLRHVQVAAVEAAKAVDKDERIVLKRVFEGIKATDQGLELEFSAWTDEPEKIFERLEGEYNERLNEQLAINESFEVEGFLPNFDGVGS